MGNEGSSLMIQHPLPKDYKCSSSNPNIYASIINNPKLQKHTLSIASKQDLLYEQEMFIYRKCHSDHIVAARYFENQSRGQYCSNQYQISFYTEYPEYDLNAIQHLSFQDGCTYLIDALKGFNILTQKVGWFRVNNKMIVFDRDHRIKVWLSDNFSETKIRNQRRIRTQSQFLTKIINTFDNKLQSSSNSYQKLIERNLSGHCMKSCTIELALNILIMYAQKQLATHQISQSHHLQKQSKDVSFSKNIECKQKSLKRNKRKSQEQIQPSAEQNTLTTKHNQSTNFKSNNSHNESIAIYSLSSNSNAHQQHSNKIPPKNDFTFHLGNNSQNAQYMRLNLLGVNTDRNQYRNFQSYQKNNLNQNKNRKSMDEYQIQPHLQMAQPIYIQPHMIKHHIYHQSLAPTINHQPQTNPNNIQRKGYPICQAKHYMQNTKTFNGDKLQSLQQPKTNKQKTSITSNLKIKDSIKLKQTQSRKQTNQNSQNIVPAYDSNLAPSYDSKKVQFDRCHTINSIVYSDIGCEEQKPSSIILNSINKGDETNIVPSTPSFSKYKR